jgi:membrane-anchored glycerophosphoryl diester phosphodiesterase (GDPDase)
MSNFLSKSNNFAVNLFIHQVTSSTWLSNLFGFTLIFIYRIYLGFYPYAVVINQQVGWQALKISYRRLKGRWLDVVVQDFALSLVLGTLVFLILFIVSLPF